MLKNSKKINFQTLVLLVKTRLSTRNYFITIERKIKGGKQIRLSTGGKINILKNGRIILKGKEDSDLLEMFGFLRS